MEENLVLRPWGSYRVLAKGESYQIKEIRVNPGNRLSYQVHKMRSEHWLVLKGEAEVMLDGERFKASIGESIDIPIGSAHRIGAGGVKELVFIEIQRGEYLEEDDIERLEDDYGR